MGDPNITLPSAFMNRGPQPDRATPFTFVAEESSVDGVLVSCGATDRRVKRCDVGEYPIGWSQGKMVADKEVTIHVFGPIVKVDVDAASDAISYGDIVEVANDGKVKKGAGVSPGVIVGIALSAAAASGQVLVTIIQTVPDPTT